MLSSMAIQSPWRHASYSAVLLEARKCIQRIRVGIHLDSEDRSASLYLDKAYMIHSEFQIHLEDRGGSE